MTVFFQRVMLKPSRSDCAVMGMRRVRRTKKRIADARNLTLCNMVAAIDKAIMLKSTEELMKARAAHADDAAAYVSSPMFICSSPRIHTRFQSGAPS